MSTVIDKRLVRLHFNHAAHRYDQWASLQRKLVDELFDRCTLPASVQQIADLGCGTGYALNRLSWLYPHAALYGLDIAQAMITQSAQHGNYHLSVGDMETLPYGQNSFDMVCSTSALQWCTLSRTLNELSRVLQTGGKLILVTFANGTLAEWRSLWNNYNAIDRHQFTSHVELLQNLEHSGFNTPRITSACYYQHFQSLRQAADSIKQLGAGNAVRYHQNALLNKSAYRLVQRKAHKIIRDEGCITLTYHALFVEAILSK